MTALEKELQQTINDQKSQSIQDIYINMVRGKRLYYENFQQPDIVAKCVAEKEEMSWKLKNQRQKIWKPNYNVNAGIRICNQHLHP